MANDRLGNAIVAGQIFALAGTVRAIDGDSILIVVGERGEHAFRCKAGHIVKVDDTTSGGGGGAPTSAQYILAATNGSLPNGRVLANSFSVEWDVSVAGQVSANLGSGVLPAVIGVAAGYFAPLVHVHAASDITSGTFGTSMIADGAITDAKIRDGAALSVVGRSANSTGDVADIAAGTDGHVLRRSGTTLGFGTIATGGVADDAVTDAKLRNSAALSVIGRSANSTGDPADIAASADGDVLRRSGTTLGFGTVATAGIADNAISNAKIRDSAALSVIGRGANSTGDPADIAASSDGGVLRRKGSAIAFGQILASAVDIDTAAWSGFLDSARVAGLRNLQELLDHIDANGLDAP